MTCFFNAAKAKLKSINRHLRMHIWLLALFTNLVNFLKIVHQIFTKTEYVMLFVCV